MTTYQIIVAVVVSLTIFSSAWWIIQLVRTKGYRRKQAVDLKRMNALLACLMFTNAIAGTEFVATGYYPLLGSFLVVSAVFLLGILVWQITK